MEKGEAPVLQRHYKFADAICEVHVHSHPATTGGPVYRAVAFVVENGGRSLREVKDEHGNRVQTHSSVTAESASEDLAALLEKRFGDRYYGPFESPDVESPRPIKK